MSTLESSAVFLVIFPYIFPTFFLSLDSRLDAKMRFCRGRWLHGPAASRVAGSRGGRRSAAAGVVLLESSV